MKKTLQDQYLLIKEGKGHKGVFLAEAKRDFPHIVPNAATFEEAAASLKTKNIINENIISLTPINYLEPTKKPFVISSDAVGVDVKVYLTSLIVVPPSPITYNLPASHFNS